MRVLADENVPLEAIEVLRGRGHDVAWIREVAPGSSDERVMERAQNEERALLTFDKDFGELAFRRGLAASFGVILLRFQLTSPSHIALIISSVLEGRGDWSGHFSVVEDARIRMTPLIRDVRDVEE